MTPHARAALRALRPPAPRHGRDRARRDRGRRRVGPTHLDRRRQQARPRARRDPRRLLRRRERRARDDARRAARLAPSDGALQRALLHRRLRALHRQRDNIIVDLLTPFGSRARPHFIVGGLLGQWGVWTERAVALLDEIKRARRRGGLSAEWLRRNVALTDANAALFDPAHGFAGCLPGIHEVLRRQGICETTACLDPRERLSPGQAVELDRVSREYAWLVDDAFVRKNLDRWLA